MAGQTATLERSPEVLLVLDEHCRSLGLRWTDHDDPHRRWPPGPALLALVRRSYRLLAEGRYDPCRDFSTGWSLVARPPEPFVLEPFVLEPEGDTFAFEDWHPSISVEHAYGEVGVGPECRPYDELRVEAEIDPDGWEPLSASLAPYAVLSDGTDWWPPDGQLEQIQLQQRALDAQAVDLPRWDPASRLARERRSHVDAAVRLLREARERVCSADPVEMRDRLVVELRSEPSGPTRGTWLPWVELRWSRGDGSAGRSGWVADDRCRGLGALPYTPGLKRELAAQLRRLRALRSQPMCQPDLSSVVAECVREAGLDLDGVIDVRLTRRTRAQREEADYRGGDGLVGEAQSRLAIHLVRGYPVTVSEVGPGILGTRWLVPDMRRIGLLLSDAQRLAEEALCRWEAVQRQRC